MNQELRKSLAENIYHCVMEGKSPEDAAEMAAKDVGEHLLATLLMQVADGKSIVIDRLIKDECGL